MTTGRIYGLIILIIVVLLGVWLSQKIVITHSDQRHPPAESIINNPFSALQHLLRQRGITTETYFNRDLLSELPATTDTLVLSDMVQPLLSSQLQALLEWVEGGGHLLYETHSPYSHDNDSGLLPQLGLQIDWAYDSGLQWRHSQFSLNDENGFIVLQKSYVLSSDNKNAEVLLRSEAGVQAYRLRYGEGLVTVISDSSFMETPTVWLYGLGENDEVWPQSGVNSHDNAYFSYSLLKDSAAVWFIKDKGSLSLLALTARYFPMTVIFAGLWLILFFVALLRREGPQIEQLGNQQQNLKQHLIQAGRFHWQQDKAVNLLHTWRQRVIRRLQRRQPQLAALTPTDMATILEQQTDFSQQQIELALTSRPYTHKDFVLYIRILRALWKL